MTTAALSFENVSSRSRDRVRFVLLTIVLVSVTLRLLSAVYQGDAVGRLPGMYDEVSYDALARNVAAGHGFTFSTNWWPATRAGEPTAHWSYAYTLYLAVIYKLFGPHPVIARVIQAAVAGILHPWLAWRLGSQALGQQCGLVAALISSLYAYFIAYAGALMTEAFYIVLILCVLDLASRFTPEAGVIRRSYWVALGFAAGAAVLLRQVFLLFIPVLFLWFLWLTIRSRPVPQNPRPVLAGLVTAAAVVGLVITPWTIRNYSAYKSFVLLNTNAGFAMFWANHPVHGARFIPVLPESGSSYGALIPEGLRQLDEARLDRALLVLALQQIVQDPGRYLRLSVSRLVEYFKFWPTSASRLSSNAARLLSSGLLLPLALLGVCLVFGGTLLDGAAGSGRHEGGSSPAAVCGLLGLFAASYTLLHVLSWALIRYRLPVDAALTVFAAAGAIWLYRLVQRGTRGDAAAGPFSIQ